MSTRAAVTPWHSIPLGEVATALATDPLRGLSRTEAASRLARDGPNTLRSAPGPSLLVLLADQFRSLVVWLLIAGAVVSVALCEWIDGSAILTIVVLNAVIGFFQEYRAERAVAALARLPALALATDPIEPGVMQRPPRPASAQLADGTALRSLLLTGALTAAVALAAYWFELRRGSEVDVARKAAFSTLVFAKLLRSFGARSARRLVHEIGIFSNLRLLAIVTATFLLQLAIHHESHLARLFSTSSLSLAQCATQIALGCVPLVVLALRNLMTRRSEPREVS